MSIKIVHTLILFCVIICLLQNVTVNCDLITENQKLDEFPFNKTMSIGNVNLQEFELTFVGDDCKFKYIPKNLIGENSFSLRGQVSINKSDVSCQAKKQQLNATGEFEQLLYRTKFIKECIIPFVYTIELTTTEPIAKNAVNHPSSFPNLSHLNWIMLGKCHSPNELISNFKNLSILSLTTHPLNRDCYNELQNIEHEPLKELHLYVAKVRRREMTRERVNLTETFLSGMKNLELFEFDTQTELTFIELNIDKQMFQGLTNLSKIILSYPITFLDEDHFRNLTNLKFLRLLTVVYSKFGWIRSEALQNNLEYLDIAITKAVSVERGIEEALSTYKKLKILDILESQLVENIFESKIHKLSAFVCRRNKKTCQFISDKHKKPCPISCRCSLFRPKMRFDIVCRNSTSYQNITELPIPMTGDTSLNFEYSNLTTLPTIQMNGYSEVRELHLKNNQLFNITVDQLPTNLTHLDLRNNLLEGLNKDVLEYFWNRSSSLVIKLSGNPWICNCETQHLIRFVIKHANIKDRTSINCSDPSIGQMINFKLDQCEINNSTLITAIIGVNTALIIILIVYFRYKQLIILWLYENGYCLQWITRPEPEVGFVMKNDAFLAFSSVDLKYAEEFVEALENGSMKYKVCYYHRDWLPGESIPECILKSIEESKRTIILMTENFIKSSWGRFEFRSAIKAASENKCKRLIVILYPDVDVDGLDSELKSYLKYNTYMSRDDPHFWRKLLFAMPHKHRNVLADSETPL